VSRPRGRVYPSAAPPGSRSVQPVIAGTFRFLGRRGVVGSEIKGSDGTPQPCTYLYGGAPYPTDCTKGTDAGKKMLKCIVSGSTYEGIFIVSSADGTPLFFPVDGDTFTPTSELVHAQIPPLYDATATWPYDLDDSGRQRLHNFSFTSEIHYWFKYDAANPIKLDITGDDDVWVFINKKLAVDLGGIHTPVSGSVTLDAATATKLGLADGNFYEIAVFQAERQSDSSTFRITMAGFNSQTSECTPL